MEKSTLRLSLNSTLQASASTERASELREQICADWARRGQADMVAAVQQHPELLQERSLFLMLALDEYESHRAKHPVNLVNHCERFKELGDSIYISVQRQLEVQWFIDELQSQAHWPVNGEDFGGFEVVEQLGAGASSRVYLCREKEIGNRLVVVKVSPQISFEASILGRLQHPNITPIHSTGFLTEWGLHYLCMPYIGRTTLADVVQLAFQNGCPYREEVIQEAAKIRTDDDLKCVGRPRFAFRNLQIGTYVDGILRMAEQLAAALEVAHERWILHGDLKPSNVLLTPAGKPMLLDFHLSQDCDQASALPGGTLPYMPPEQLQRILVNAKSHGVQAFSPAADIYSFGALLYELLSGLPPVSNVRLVGDLTETAAAIHKQLEQGIRDVRSHNPLVSHKLSDLITRCLAFQPDDRPATIAEVGKALRAERRGLTSFVRRARVRPIACFSFFGLPTLLLLAGGGYVSSLPPGYMRDFERGVASARSDRLPEAITYLTSAVIKNPEYIPARFQLAEAHLAAGEYDLAISEFGYLMQHKSHRPSRVKCAYCYNLKLMPTVALVLYEGAMKEGMHSAAIHNNYAASNMDGSSALSLSDRIQLAELHLNKAYVLAPNCNAIHLNYLRLAVHRSRLARSFDPFTVWQHARAALKNAPADESTLGQVASWWWTVLDYEKRQHVPRHPTPVDADHEDSDEYLARQEFAAVVNAKSSAPNLLSKAPDIRNFAIHIDHFYIDPDVSIQ